MYRKLSFVLFLLAIFGSNILLAQTEGITFGSADTTVWTSETVHIGVTAEDELGTAIPVNVVSLPVGASFDPVLSIVSWVSVVPTIGQLIFSAQSGSGTEYISDVLVVVRGELYPQVYDQALRDSLRINFSPEEVLGYDVARDSMYANLYLDGDGFVRGIYTDFAVELTAGDPSVVMDQGGINAEHIWLQSMGASAEPQKSDLYNLAPAKANINSSRSNKPFFVIADINVQNWYRLEEILQSIPTENKDEYSRSAPGQWQPRRDAMGDIARSVDYFYIVHNDFADSTFFELQRGQIQGWSQGDPPTMEEYRRAIQIRKWQGNLNPFLLDPNLHIRLFGLSEVLGNESDEFPLRSGLEAEVFPNPSSGRFTVKYSAMQPNEPFEISVFDLLGRRVFFERAFASAGTHVEKGIELPGLSNGVYFVSIAASSGNDTIPLIISN